MVYNTLHALHYAADFADWIVTAFAEQLYTNYNYILSTLYHIHLRPEVSCRLVKF